MMSDPAPPLDLEELDAEIAYGREYAPVWERDQWYVAYMHDVPALVARVRALEAENQRLRSELHACGMTAYCPNPIGPYKNCVCFDDS